MPKKQNLPIADPKGQRGAVPLLILIAAVGVIGILAVTSIAPLRNQLLSTLFPKDSSQAFTPGGWTMAGANPQRTSWTPDEAPGDLNEKWVRPIEPYISMKIQVIGANTPSGKSVFVSTSKGLLAYDAETGAEKWQFGTELPLGNAPSYDNGVLFVGGLDRNVYAINHNGTLKWKFSGAQGGFQTNPLVINNTVYIGSRDGYMYALNASDGSEKWKYKAGGQNGAQILQSAAASKDNQIIYFAAMDSRLYALDAATGADPLTDSNSRTWISPQFKGNGFHSWWPVVYRDKILLAGSADQGSQIIAQQNWLFPSQPSPKPSPGGASGEIKTETAPGQEWPVGQKILDVKTNPFPGGKTIPDYFEEGNFPERKVLFVVNQSDGSEQKFDVDGDGKEDSAITHTGQENNSDYPPVIVDKDNDGDQNDPIYTRTTNWNTNAIPGASIIGWKMGTSLMALTSSPFTGQSGHLPQDESVGLSAGGKYLYSNLCCDRYIASIDVSLPNTTYPARDNSGTRTWRIVEGALPPARGNSMPNVANGANADYFSQFPQYFWNPDAATFDDGNGPGIDKFHIEHADNAGPAIFDGKMFVVRSNALIAFDAIPTATKTVLPVSNSPADLTNQPAPLTKNNLETRLQNEIQKIISAGPLRSGRRSVGLFEVSAQFFDEDLLDYWHSPGENIRVLLRALPLLPDTVYPGETTKTWKQKLGEYIQAEYTRFGSTCAPCNFRHIGFNGAKRESFDQITPPLTNQGATKTDPKPGFSIDSPYGLWKYAEYFAPSDPEAKKAFAKAIFDQFKNKMGAALASTALPQLQNKRTMGLTGYVELQKMAGLAPDSRTQELNDLLSLRAQQLRWDVRYLNPPDPLVPASMYYPTLITAWNFMYLTPELTTYLVNNPPAAAENKPDKIIEKYEQMAPYWFIGHNEEVQMENGVTPYQQTHTLFQAKAMILKLNQQQLSKYLDSPVVPVGDMYYIDNLAAALEAPIDPTVTPPPSATPPASTPASPSPSPSASPPVSSGSILAGTGQSVYPDASLPPAAILSGMISDAVNEAKTSFGSNTPKLVLTMNNAGGQQELIDKIKEVFGSSAPIAGEGTGSEKYPSLTDEEFVEPMQRSVAVLALGGGIDDICNGCMNQQVVGQGANEAQIRAAGQGIGNGLKPHLNPNKQNLILILGPGHSPNLQIMFEEIKAVIGGGAIPGYVKFIGGGADFTGNSIANGVLTSLSVTGVLIQGDFKLALRGVGPGFGGDPVQKSTDLMNEMKTELGSAPDITFYIAGHPEQEGATRASMLSAAKSVLGSNAKIFGNTGGGEYGHLTTNDQPLALPQYFFIAGLKGTTTSASTPPSGKTGDISGISGAPDGKVDIWDFNQLLTDFGKTGNFTADIDQSGKVDIFDYNILLTNFGI